jgi:hypothetical protein
MPRARRLLCCAHRRTTRNGAVEFKVGTSAAVVADVVLGEEHRYLHRERNRIIDEHETLKCLVA